MKVKNIRIALRSDEELLHEIKDVWQNVEKGAKLVKHEGLYFENLEAMRKVLTENRLKMLRTIRRDRPSSIYELAKLLERDVKNTYDDVEFLAGIGLVEVKKTKEGRERTTPTVNYEKTVLEIAV